MQAVNRDLLFCSVLIFSISHLSLELVDEEINVFGISRLWFDDTFPFLFMASKRTCCRQGFRVLLNSARTGVQKYNRLNDELINTSSMKSCFILTILKYKVDGNLMVKGTREGPLVICDQH